MIQKERKEKNKIMKGFKSSFSRGLNPLCTVMQSVSLRSAPPELKAMRRI